MMSQFIGKSRLINEVNFFFLGENTQPSGGLRLGPQLVYYEMRIRELQEENV